MKIAQSLLSHTALTLAVLSGGVFHTSLAAAAACAPNASVSADCTDLSWTTGDLTNSATITSTTFFNGGVHSPNPAPANTTAGTFTNTASGVIQGGNAAMTLAGPVVGVSNYGLIKSTVANWPTFGIQASLQLLFNAGTIGSRTSSPYSALYISSFSNSTASTRALVDTLNNTGTIVGRYGIFMDTTGSPEILTRINTLDNSGTIEGTAGHGVYNSGQSIGTINNAETGVIVGASGSAGIVNEDWNLPGFAGGVIETINNMGAIYSANGFGIDNRLGAIQTLNNAQGGDRSGATTKALTYAGALPTFYNVVISSATHYGQLDVTSASGVMTFGVSENSQKITSLTYAGVLKGLMFDQIANRTGTFQNADWRLVWNSTTNVWDLAFTSLPYYGPNVANTRLAMLENAATLRRLMERRAESVALMANYDCATFDARGVCLSFQARYSNLNSMNEGAGVLTGAYRLNEHWRVGAFIDAAATEKDTGRIKTSGEQPTFGAFLAYSAAPSGAGLQGKLLAAYGKSAIDITRDGGAATNTESGTGRSTLRSTMVAGEVGYGFALSPSLLATPFLGLRSIEIARDGYAESASDATQYPASYRRFAQRALTATAGLRLSGMFTSRLGFQLGAGVEQDLTRKTSSYSGGASMPGLENFALAAAGSARKTRGFASAGLFYQLTENQRFVANVGLRTPAAAGRASATAMGGYQLSF